MKGFSCRHSFREGANKNAPPTMKRVVRSERVELDDKSLPINTRPKAGMGCYLEILEALSGQMDAMLAHHARVLFIRIDIRPPGYTADNEPMRRYMRKLVKRLKRSYGVKRVGYLWVREIEKSKQQHYHLVLMLDGRAVRHPARIIALAEEIAESWGWPKPFTVKKCYRMVGRNDTTAYSEVFERVSYLAKERGKGYRSKKSNDYSGSRLKCGLMQ